jgi:hypothetical protein
VVELNYFFIILNETSQQFPFATQAMSNGVDSKGKIENG